MHTCRQMGAPWSQAGAQPAVKVKSCPQNEGTNGNANSKSFLQVPEPSSYSDGWLLQVSLIPSQTCKLFAYLFWTDAQDFHVCEDFPLGFHPSFLC